MLVIIAIFLAMVMVLLYYMYNVSGFIKLLLAFLVGSFAGRLRLPAAVAAGTPWGAAAL